MAQVLILGNTAEPAGKRFSWVFYVRGATHLVSKVTIMLHPTFKNPVRESTGPAFEFKSSGWGTFDLEVIITWKSGTELRTVWPLQFDAPDANQQLEVPADVIACCPSEGPLSGPFGHAVDSDGSSYDGISADPAELLSSFGMAALEEVSPEREEFAAHGAPEVNETFSAHAVADVPARNATDVPASKAKSKAKGRARTPPSYRPRGKAKGAPKSGSQSATADEQGARTSASVKAEIRSEDLETMREAVCAQLVSQPFLHHSDPLFMHGRAFQGPLVDPKCIWPSKKKPRDDHDAPSWLTASEYEDEPTVMQAKCKQLAMLLRMSRRTVAYTGAGISAAVIGQAARSGQNKVGWKPDTRKAQPTYTHHALGFLGQRGIIHSWVQQNHDGLPQKAGFPQECINEIHGSWYDPCNPVVKYSGSLHDRAYPWMQHDAATADLVLVLGTSLGGLNADQVCTLTAERSLVLDSRSGRGALGSVIMNLQQTEQDGTMSLRFFGKSDIILRLLLQELDFGRLTLGMPAWTRESRALVPYDRDGRRTEPGTGRRMWLDLRDGQRVRLAADHNIQGARQPQYMHIGASKPVTYKGTTHEPGIGLGSVVRRDEDSCSWILQIEGAQMRLGFWWLESAIRGGVEALPLINERPTFE